MRLTGDERSATQQVEDGGPSRVEDKRPRKRMRLRDAAGPGSSVRLALTRLGRTPALFALLTLGILAASVMASTIPLYNALVGNVELQHTLAASAPVAHNLDAFARYDYAFQDPAGLDQAVRNLAEHRVGSITAPTPLHYAISDALPMVKMGTRTLGGGYEAQLWAMDYGFTAPHMHFLAGRAPQTTSGAVPEAIVPAQLAQTYGVRVGDAITVVGPQDPTNSLTVRVVGIWEPDDANDPFWNGLSFFQYPDGVNLPLVTSVALAFSDFFPAVSGGITPEITEHWIWYTQLQQITTQNIQAIIKVLGDFQTDMRQNLPVDRGLIVQSGVATRLLAMLQDVNRQTALLALPLYFVVAPTIGLALLFIAEVAAMLIEAQALELATLKSRGLSNLQLLGAFALQGVPPAVLALVVGPPLAAGAALVLVRSVVPLESLAQSRITPGFLARVTRPGDALLAAVLAALCGFLALTVTAGRSARFDVLAFRREEGRSARTPLWRRLHLDLFLAVICALGYLDLAQFGTTSMRLALGDLANSPLLLAAPSLLLLAGALLLLRLLPPAAYLGARLAGRARGLISQMAFTSIARHPARYGSVVLLLALAVGLGLFAVTYNSALALNTQDRASYQAGADLRLELLSTQDSETQRKFETALAAFPGITDKAPVFREQAAPAGASDPNNQALTLLGVDPASFTHVAAASWRDDYGDASLADLMGRLADHTGADRPILISDTLAGALGIGVGGQFSLGLQGADLSRAPFKVVAIVHAFPTLYPGELPLGFAVANLSDLSAAIDSGQNTAVGGPNEYWLTISPDPHTQQTLIQTLQAHQVDLSITSLVSRSDTLHQIEANPLNAGMRGLLLAGAGIAVILALLGILAQSTLAIRQRATQFAVLRALGMTRSQLSNMLLGEQLVVYLMGTLGGTALGLLLATATLPFLQFGDTTLDPATLGVPPYRLAFDLSAGALFYGALLAAFALSLVVAARYASRLGLGRALRVGED
jgi:ABC-type lipoprotein release transport system permease subunit